MSKILLQATRKYPSIPTVGSDPKSLAVAVQAIRDAVQTHERRDGDPLSSFLRLRELIDLGLVRRVGKELVLTFDPADVGTGGGGAVSSVNGQTGAVSLGLGDLNDVDLSGLADGDVLTYDATYGLWLPQPPAAGGSGAMTKLASVTLGSPAASISFSSISQAYTSLLITMSINSGTNLDIMYMQFNGDTSTHYDTAYVYGGGSSGGVQSLATTKPEIASMPGTTFDSRQRWQGTISIPYYSDTTQFKTSTSNAGRRDAGNMYFEGYLHNWHSPNAITDILFAFVSGNNFVTGSRMDLYGID